MKGPTDVTAADTNFPPASQSSSNPLFRPGIRVCEGRGFGGVPEAAHGSGGGAWTLRLSLILNPYLLNPMPMPEASSFNAYQTLLLNPIRPSFRTKPYPFKIE